MSVFLELAAAVHTKSLTLFVGTGFSKFMTNGTAPSWTQLLVECCRNIDDSGNLFEQLFNTYDNGEVLDARYELQIVAQILELEYRKLDLNFKEAISEVIRSKINEETIDKEKLLIVQDYFTLHPEINIVTTNYDTLFAEFIIPNSSRPIIEGSNYPRININQSIYHVHGCITKPSSIIITLNDYYKFQNVNNYFSRKFYTLLQESTVAILGYSLGDFNLNTILSEVKNSKKESFRKSDIFFVSKNKIPEIMKSFYDATYGISVIEKTEVDEFFEDIENEFERAVEIIGSTEQLQNFLTGRYTYEEDFIKLKICITLIFILASSLGLNKDDTNFLNKLLEILYRKVELCKEPSAWPQYSHLANWLIDISSTIVIKDSPIEKEFCEIVNFSISTSSSTTTYGYSWEAWRIWRRRFNEMKWDNQYLLIDCIEKNSPSLYTSLAVIKK